MLVLADRGCDPGGLLSEIAATGAVFPVRGTSTRKPPVPRLPGDGSHPPDLDGPQAGSSRLTWRSPAPAAAGSGTAAG
jgi:hypothetical protein